MNATASSFLGWLLRSSWQAAVLTVLVLLAQFCLRKRLDGRWRHLLWLLVLARLAIPFSPPSPASLFNYLRFESAAPQTVPIVDFAVAPPRELPIQIQPSAYPQTVHVTAATAPTLPPAPRVKWTMPAWPVLLTMVWAAGVAALAMRVVVQNILFRRRLRDGTAMDDARILELFENCKGLMRGRTRVRLIETHLVDSPALYGLFRPRLLLPPKLAERFSPNELRHIFLHELAHVRRRDMAAQWLVMCFQIAHWFNPILWFGFRRMAADRELACDELALSVVGESEGPAYGQTIIKLLEACSEMPALPGLVGILEDKSQIFQRVSMIAQFKKHPRWSFIGAVAAVVLGLATLTGAQTEKAPEAPQLKSTATVRMTNSPALGEGEFHVTGAIIDAETRKPLDAFAITKGYDPQPIGLTKWRTTIHGTNGRFDVLLSTYPVNQANFIAVQADGYLPESSGIVTAETNITLALTRAIGRTGVVLNPDGQPAAGVRVYLTDQQSAVYVGEKDIKVNEHVSHTGGIQITNTDNTGRFTFEPGLDDTAIMVLAKEGFAQVGVRELSEHPEVKLQTWSKVQGQLWIGSRPASNETIRLQPAFSFFDGYNFRDFRALKLFLDRITDNEGRFSFDRVPPIDIEVSHDPWARNVKPDRGIGLISKSQTVSFSLKPGEIKTVTLGGNGRPVIGQFVVNGYDGKINWRNVPQHLNLILPPSADYDNHQALLDELNEKIETAPSQDEKGRLCHERAMLEYDTAAKRHAFIKTEKGKEYYFQSKPYDMDIAPDGTFRIEDVPGGKYSMNIQLHEGDWPRSGPGPIIVNFSKDFEIPDSLGGRSDEPFDLGKIEMQHKKDPAFGSAASDSGAKRTARSDWSGKRLREPGLAGPSQRLTPAEAEALDAKLLEDPEDFSARRDLLAYYGFRDRGAKAKHVLWIIEHHPEFSGNGPEMSLDPIIEGSSYRQGKALWLKNVKDNPTNTVILGNAAAYFLIHDNSTAEELLTKAQILEPQNPAWPERLGQLYKLEANGQPGTNAAAKALAEFEKAQSQTSPATAGNPRLVDLAQMAIEAGDLEKARTYASELLGPGLRWSGGGNSGRALFYGNLVLGRIALREGKLDEASQYLLKAGKTTGDPALDSFGPNMSLAKELLEKGKTNSVLEFFQECGKFWPQYGGENKMAQWTAEVKEGKTPNFGANLVY